MRIATGYRAAGVSGSIALLLSLAPQAGLSQGSVFGSVLNADATTPADGTISFFGFLDDHDEELRIESSVGAGYDAGNWYDDFQNYLTEVPGIPFDYHFRNAANGEGYHLEGIVPNNSFQQVDVQLAPVAWPDQPTGLTGSLVSSSSVLLEWDDEAAVTWHVYRRTAPSNGSFFRIDDPTGDLADPGTVDNFFLDHTVDGVSTYHYMVIAENSAGEFSMHSAIVALDSSELPSPVRHVQRKNLILDPCFPNPFNPGTTIAFELPRPFSVTLNVLDLAGRQVRTLIDGDTYGQGRHEVAWSGRDDAGRQMGSGIYFYRLATSSFSETKRMVLAR